MAWKGTTTASSNAQLPGQRQRALGRRVVAPHRQSPKVRFTNINVEARAHAFNECTRGKRIVEALQGVVVKNPRMEAVKIHT